MQTSFSSLSLSWKKQESNRLSITAVSLTYSMVTGKKETICSNPHRPIYIIKLIENWFPNCNIKTDTCVWCEYNLLYAEKQVCKSLNCTLETIWFTRVEFPNLMYCIHDGIKEWHCVFSMQAKSVTKFSPTDATHVHF